MTEDLQALESRIAAGFSKVGLVLRHEAWRSGGKHGLTPTQSQILAAVTTATEPLRPKAIAALLALTLSTVSEAVTTLVAKGLVEKHPDPSDGRATIVKVTRAGRRQGREAAVGPASLLEAAKGLTATQQEGLMVGLVGVISSLQRQGLVPVSGMCVGCAHFRPHAHGDRHHCELIDAPLSNVDLRLDCPDQEPVEDARAGELWSAFLEGRPASS